MSVSLPVTTLSTVHTGPVIDINFEVPYKNAHRDLVIPSNTSFPTFLSRAAEKMETSLVCLAQIGYILPWKLPKSGKPVPKLLDDEDSYKKLLDNVWAHIDEQKSKNKGKGKVKPFSIQIVDTSEPAGAGKVRQSHLFVLA